MKKTPDLKVAENFTISLDYTLIIEGETLESTIDSEPIQFIQGLGQIIPGLENALYGMTMGETKTVNVPAAEAYGEIDPEAIHKANKNEFDLDIPLDVGTFFDLRDKNGDTLSAQIIAKDEDTVTLDFNHPLAGKDLVFEVKVVDLRPATEEELAEASI